MPAAASAMSAEWAATETGSTMPRRAPRSLAPATAASTAARSPEITTWPGALRLATVRLPCGSAEGDQLGEPRVIEADDGRHGARSSLAGGLHLAAALADEPDRVAQGDHACRDHGRVLAHGVAGGVGGLRDGDAGRRPTLAKSGQEGDRDGHQGGLSVDRQVELLGRAVESQAADRLAQRVVGLREDAEAAGEAAARALPMPTDWDPWPGNTNAIRSMSCGWSPSARRRTPGRARPRGAGTVCPLRPAEGRPVSCRQGTPTPDGTKERVCRIARIGRSGVR